MATAPTYATIPNAGTPATLTTGNPVTDGSPSSGRALVFTAGAGGSYLPFLRIKPLGNNVASVLRVFLNNGSDPNIPGNNALIYELALPASTLSQIAAMGHYEVPIGVVPPLKRVYVFLGTTVVAGVTVTPINAGDL